MQAKDVDTKDILFMVKSGSHAYGLNTPTSDIDIRGVFVAPKRLFYGMSVPDQASDETNDTTFFELSKFMSLLSSQNPNIIELLGIPDDCIIQKHPLFDRILEHKDKLITRQIRNTFGGYAIAQIGKSRGLNKKIVQPMDKEKKSPLDFCFVPRIDDAFGSQTMLLKRWLKRREMDVSRCGLSSLPHIRNGFALFYDERPDSTPSRYRGVCFEDSNDIHLSSIPEHTSAQCVVFYDKDQYSKYCRDYKEYWDWVANRNPARYQKNMDIGKGYDSKNIMHCVRLLRMAEEMLTTGELIVRRPDRADLLDIRNGLRDYDEMMEYANSKIALLDTLVLTSPLPAEVDKELLNNLLIDIRNDFYSGAH